MGEFDKSSKLEKVQRRRLSFANRLRLYGSLAGTLGLIALAAVGCGGKGSSGGKEGTPHNSGNTPVLPGATDTGDSAPTYSDDDQKKLEDYIDEQEKEDEQAAEGLPSDTAVDVELYSEDGSGDTYTTRMSFEEMQALCEEQRQQMIEEAEAAGSELIGGPIVILPYTVVGTGQVLDYTCGQA